MEWFALLALGVVVATIAVVAGNTTPVSGPSGTPIPQPPSPENPDPVVTSGTTVAIIGDSLGVGLTSPLRRLAVGQGAKLLGYAFVSARIDQWVSKLDEVPGSPDVWLVSLGTNDFGGVKERGALAKLAEKLAARGGVVRWLEPAPSPKIPHLPSIMDMVRENEITIIPPPPGGYERASDQIHPTAKGSETWAEWIWQNLNGEVGA